jgi:hypothetical protein
VRPSAPEKSTDIQTTDHTREVWHSVARKEPSHLLLVQGTVDPTGRLVAGQAGARGLVRSVFTDRVEVLLPAPADDLVLGLEVHLRSIVQARSILSEPDSREPVVALVWPRWFGSRVGREHRRG